MSVMVFLNGNNKAALKRFAELIAVNSGNLTLAGKIGDPQPTDKNRYGRMGLTFEEACELQYMRGIFEGILMITQGTHAQEAQQAIQREISGQQIEIATQEQVAAFLNLGQYGKRN